MCGITGFLGNYPRKLLDDMCESIAHRGPDGQGIWYDGDTKIGLGHRRLAIIDLTDNAKQPMAGVEGRYITTFNGEIYNFKELAADLNDRGYKFNQKSDTAILAPLYDCYGAENMLKKLSGIFAFAIWDRKERSLFIARDHLGIKPLYYAKTPEGLMFSSELKALMQHTAIDKSLDMEAVFAYVSYLWSPGENTMLRGIKKLLPGHFAICKTKEINIHKWYSPPLTKIENGKPTYNDNKTSQDLLNLLDEVVREQTLSDVPVGAFLSGGVDSSAIVASMASQDKRPIEAFCINFAGTNMEDEGFSNDFDYAKKVADKYNVNLNEMQVSEDCLHDLPTMVYHLDEPQADPAPLYVRLISKAAKEKGIKVLMAGTGGDDIFSGYRRHQAISMMHNIRFIPPKLRKSASNLLLKIAKGANFKRRIEKLRYLLETDVENSLIRSYHYTTNSTLADLLTPEMADLMTGWRAKHLRCAMEETTGQHPLNRQLFMEAHGFLPDHNLNYTDKMGMAEGVEIRVPLLDPKMLEFATDLPLNQKLNGSCTKYILKKSLESRLPKSVLYRSKAGFGAPIRSWLTGSSAELMEDLLLSPTFTNRKIFNPEGVNRLIADTKNGVRDGAYTLLSLMVIELWMRQFIDVAKPVKLVA